MSKATNNHAITIELENIEKGIPPRGWIATIPFDKDSMGNEHLHITNLNVLPRAIIGHFQRRNRARSLTIKNIVEEALREYLENHKDDLV
jgi:hypothetical protein